MPTLIDAYQQVESPNAVPYRFGLFSVVEPRPETDPHWRLGVEWRSRSCGDIQLTNDPCLVEDFDELDPDRLCSVSQFDPFTVAILDVDSAAPIGDPDASASARLTNGEQLAAERGMWDQLDLTAPTDLSGCPVDVALGWVEQQIAQQYGSAGVIHVSRLTATILGDALRAEGGRLVTRLGTPVIAGGGYDEVADPPAVEALIVGTGPLVMYRGQIETYATFDRTVNDHVTIAQRTYLIGWDCVSVAASTLIPAVPTIG